MNQNVVDIRLIAFTLKMHYGRIDSTKIILCVWVFVFFYERYQNCYQMISKLLRIVILTSFAACLLFQPLEINSTNKTQFEELKLSKQNLDFLMRFYPKVKNELTKIEDDRRLIVWLKSKYFISFHLGNYYLWLRHTADKYRMGNDFFTRQMSEEEFQLTMDSLLKRVDVIPERLVIAQAILESGWGNSRLATEANNYFGMRCFSPDCGIPPYGIENPDYWHRRYNLPEESIADYLLNINTLKVYEKFRTTRQSIRKSGGEPTAEELVEALGGYSETGETYVSLLKDVIKFYLPENMEIFLNQSIATN